MAVRNYFSGVEGKQHYNAAVGAGAEHCLMSYLYVQKLGNSVLLDRKKANPQVKWLLDSGAHTFQTSAHKPPYVSWKVADYEKYLMEYVNWVKKNKSSLECVAELDIAYALNVCTQRKGDDAYGNQIVEKWRRTVFAPLQDLGIQVIYVYHHYNGMQGWEQMCEEYPYVGLPGELSSDADFNKYISVARRYSTKIHGFAATKQIDFSTVPWYSVDSTSWKAGERYGTIADWDDARQKFKVYEKADRPLLRSKMLLRGYKADDIIADIPGIYQEVTRYTLDSMVRMENFYKNRFKDRVFYYDLRLPAPSVILNWKEKKIMRKWRQFDPARIFTKHSTEKSPEKVRQYLIAMASVQNNRFGFISANVAATEFLNDYWPAQMTKQPMDFKEFKKEMSAFISPKNREAQERLTAADYEPTNNPPKSRSQKDWTAESLEWEPSRFQFLKQMRTVTKEPLPRIALP